VAECDQANGESLANVNPDDAFCDAGFAKFHIAIIKNLYAFRDVYGDSRSEAGMTNKKKPHGYPWDSFKL
jgi:hypothetical protein